MSRYQMPLLILCMLMISCSSNIVNAEVAAQTVDLFKPGETKAKVDGAEYSPDGRVLSFKTYSLLDVNGNMAALAFGEYGDSSDKQSYEFLSKSFKYENKKISGVIGGEWDTQVVAKKNDDPDSNIVLYGPKAVVKGSKIFSLLTRSESKAASTTRETKLFIGEVKGTGSITWNAPESLKAFLDEEAKRNSWDQIDLSSGRGIVMGGKTIVFSLVARSTSTKKSVCTVIFSEDDGITWYFPSTPVISEDCQTPSLLEWAGSLLMVSSNNPPQKLYESKDMGKTWTEARGKLPHILIGTVYVPALRYIQDRVTATIEGKNVILCTRLAGDVDRNELQLWFADSSRIHYAGPITVGAVDDDKSASTLLYAQDALFAMYNKGGEASSTVVLAHLSNQLNQIKSVLKTWKVVEKRISPPSLTNGLVGFLSNKGNTATWEDEFLGVGAIVQGSATKVDNGLKLTLPGTQVVWPIGEQGVNQVYSFTDRGFTVVAAVTIHNKPQNVTRLMGVVLLDFNLDGGYTGLSFDKDKQWKGVTVDEGSGEPNTWEEGKAYQVALVFQDGTGSVYIDGKLLGRLEDDVGGAAPNADSVTSQAREGEFIMLRGILRVYLGEQNGSNQGNINSEVTVRSVMLYNRPLSTAELEMLISDNTNSGKYSDAKTSSDENGDARASSSKNGDAKASSGKNGDARASGSKNGDALKAIKGDSSMCQRVSCLLLVFMGFLGFVSLF